MSTTTDIKQECTQKLNKIQEYLQHDKVKEMFCNDILGDMAWDDFICFIKNKTTNNIYIGPTQDILWTLNRLQENIGEDCELETVAMIPSGRIVSKEVEDLMHETFEEYRHNQHWYKIDENMIIDYLEKISIRSNVYRGKRYFELDMKKFIYNISVDLFLDKSGHKQVIDNVKNGEYTKDNEYYLGLLLERLKMIVSGEF